MKIPFLDLHASLGQDIGAYRDAFERVFQSGRFILGPEVKKFEKTVASYLQKDSLKAIGVSNGTDALIIGLRILNIGPNDEVITTAFSFFATVEAILSVGATPVLVDVDPKTLLLDPKEVEKAITKRTKAILPVHLFGAPAEMDPMRKIAEKHGLFILEDAAQAFGGSYKKQKLGAIGDVGAFSFFPSKILGAFGDAGLIITKDPERAAHARRLRTHGAARKYENLEAGYNARLDELQAAFLLVRFQRINDELKARKKVANHYRTLLHDTKNIRLLPNITGHANGYFTVLIQKNLRNHAQKTLQKHNISSMVYYPIPLHKTPALRSLQTTDLPHATQAAKEVLSLPFWPNMPANAQQKVVNTLRLSMKEAY